MPPALAEPLLMSSRLLLSPALQMLLLLVLLASLPLS
jgi:hypothetical protein